MRRLAAAACGGRRLQMADVCRADFASGGDERIRKCWPLSSGSVSNRCVKPSATVNASACFKRTPATKPRNANAPPVCTPNALS